MSNLDFAARCAYAHGTLHTIHNGHFDKLVQQYVTIIEARSQSTRGVENAVAAMVFIYNSTDSKEIKSWLMAAIWKIEQQKRLAK